MTTTMKLLHTRRKLYSQDHPRLDDDAEFARTTDFDMRSQVSGMSAREVLQEPSRTADSSDKELLSDMWKASATHIFTWWNGGDYYSGQQASGLLAPVFSRSEVRSAKDHYPFKSHRLHQHMQVVNSKSSRGKTTAKCDWENFTEDYLPQNEC